ncbi:hypothetical protein [Streptomyces griseomycini]|uniref:Uncharacterized protein n=1 Tax=Streptomyces griseomycini TaxID=66895 RepID=A0A7W7M1J7_9ACTN|nr:hypothetical protein [Streptomyces griseomycini]MBB4900194.1 hypothetical protein [Streptomyces griseomycini]GGQ11954.1 hypothetical protein GCM10010266_39030 [Streptomyces griseomycini]
MPKKAAQDREVLEQELYAAGAEPAEVEALGGRLDLVADFGDRTLRMPVSGDQGGAVPWPSPGVALVRP